jgi:Fe-S cluster assembly protein SufD
MDEGITPADLDPYTFGDATPHRLVFVDGHVSKRLSTIGALPKGVRIEDLASAIRATSPAVSAHLARYASVEENSFTALQTAFLQDGAFIHVPNGLVLEEPIHILFLATRRPVPVISSPRVLIVVGDDCRLSIVESYVGLTEGVYFTNLVSEVVIGERSVLEHDKLQMESPAAFHVGGTWFRQGAKSSITSNTINLGGSLVRNTVSAVFAGEYAECTLNGLSVGTGSQLIDNHTAIDHAVPNCASHELYKAILDGKSRGVFNGKIFVRKDAQKTDAKQTNRTLLLSDDATIDTKPQLEIFADDVKCTHGATVGQLDENQVFYLRSRGIDETAARDILTFAFASDVIGRVHVEPLRAQLDGILHQRLRAGRVTAIA